MLKLKNKFIVQPTSLNSVIPFDKYSGFNKLINVTVNIFKIRNKLKHVDEDPSNSPKFIFLR